MWGSKPFTLRLRPFALAMCQAHSHRLASPPSWARPWRTVSHSQVGPPNSWLTNPASSPVPFSVRIEEMGQRTGVLYNNALEPTSLKYVLRVISLSRFCSLGGRSQNNFWETTQTLSPLLGTHLGKVNRNPVGSSSTVHSFDSYAWRTYYAPDSVLGVGDSASTGKNPELG